MAIDLKRFHATFFAESFEGVEAMEQALVACDPATVDAETVNAIFRAAHSIKGGAATFGLKAVADFTHHLESLLDAARSGRRALDKATVDLLLEGVDVVGELLAAARDGQPCDAERVAEVQAALEAARATSPTPAAPAREGDAPSAAPAAAPVRAYRIDFAPHADLFRSGNEPLRILRELANLGRLDVRAELDALPPLAELDAESSYLRWSLTLRARCDIDAVRAPFAWVEDACDLAITPLVEGDNATASTPPAEPEPVAAVAPEIPPAPAAETVLEPAPAAAPVAPIAEVPSVVPAARATAPAPPHAEAPAHAPPAPPVEHAARATDHGTVRVRTDKLDNLMNQVGELVITQAMLAQLGAALDPVHDDKLLAGLAQLERQTRHLQEAVMATRMLPIASVFARFPRLVHDLSEGLGKPARLITSGDDTEIDRSVIEKIADPLTHLLRNAVDHGLEELSVRRAAGKPETGTIRLAAEQRSGHILVTVTDDGRGLDRARILVKARERGLPVSDTMADNEVWALVYQPGFSTRDTVTELSGRGVGMDVVRRNVQDLGGDIELASEAGRGTRVTIRLPLTLAIVDGMLVRAGEEIFILPLAGIVESMQVTPSQVHSIGRGGRLVRVRSELVPLVSLGELLNVPQHAAPEREVLVVVESGGQRLAVQVDELVGQQQVVIKSLAANYRHVRFISGATILGDGRICLILDVGELVRGIGEPVAA